MNARQDVVAYYGLSKEAAVALGVLPNLKTLNSTSKALTNAVDPVSKKLSKLPKPSTPSPTGPLGF